jgi:hypothetical protein
MSVEAVYAARIRMPLLFRAYLVLASDPLAANKREFNYVSFFLIYL